MESILKELKNELKHWWASLLIGIIFIIAAVVVICLPISSYVFISLVFSVSVLTGGLFEIIFAVANRKTLSRWGWNLTIGLIDFILGIILCATPALAMSILPILLAFWFIFKGISLMENALFLKKIHSKNWGYFLTFSILIFLCALLIFFKPSIGAIYITYMLSFILLIIGIFRIILSIDMRRIYKKIKNK